MLVRKGMFIFCPGNGFLRPVMTNAPNVWMEVSVREREFAHFTLWHDEKVVVKMRVKPYKSTAFLV